MEIAPSTPGKASLIGIFVTIFALGFMMVVCGVTLFTFVQPEYFASEARLKLIEKSTFNTADPGSSPRAFDTNLAATEVETILSELVLGEVVETCNLNAEWGRKYASGEKLKTVESLSILKGRLDVHAVRNTSIVSVRVYSDDKQEAAKLANAVSAAYQNQVAKVSPRISVIEIDRAQPGLRPVRPNKPLNIALGIVMGAVCGVGSATLVTALTANYRAGKRLAQPPPPSAGLKSIH